MDEPTSEDPAAQPPKAPRRSSGRFLERERGAEGWAPGNILGFRAWLSLGVVAYVLWSLFGRDSTAPTLQFLGLEPGPPLGVIRLRVLDPDSDWVDVTYAGETQRATRNKELRFVRVPEEMSFEAVDSGGNRRRVRLVLTQPTPTPSPSPR